MSSSPSLILLFPPPLPSLSPASKIKIISSKQPNQIPIIITVTLNSFIIARSLPQTLPIARYCSFKTARSRAQEPPTGHLLLASSPSPREASLIPPACSFAKLPLNSHLGAPSEAPRLAAFLVGIRPASSASQPALLANHPPRTVQPSMRGPSRAIFHGHASPAICCPAAALHRVARLSLYGGHRHAPPFLP